MDDLPRRMRRTCVYIQIKTRSCPVPHAPSVIAHLRLNGHTGVIGTLRLAKIFFFLAPLWSQKALCRSIISILRSTRHHGKLMPNKKNPFLACCMIYEFPLRFFVNNSGVCFYMPPYVSAMLDKSWMICSMGTNSNSTNMFSAVTIASNM